jgi:hypothetical protein
MLVMNVKSKLPFSSIKMHYDLNRLHTDLVYSFYSTNFHCGHMLILNGSMWINIIRFLLCQVTYTNTITELVHL